jgi:hypothetical protein
MRASDLQVKRAEIVASIAVGAAIVVAGGLWSGVVEVVRVGNEHLANRAALITWPARAPGVFLASVVTFWILAFATRHRRSSRPRLDEPPDWGPRRV